jgi:pyruvate kinase
MIYKEEKIMAIVAEIREIFDAVVEQESKYATYLENIHPKFKESARNLIHYRAFRSFDLRSLQKKLGNLGLSRLAKAESHVLASLDSNLKILKSLINMPYGPKNCPFISIKEGQKLLTGHAKDLFGPRTDDRKVRIMVTFPEETADQLFLVRKMMVEGMNTIRINCAQDDHQLWSAMINNSRRAMKTTGKTCKISMDLSGPKIRTGAITPGPKVLRLRPEKDSLGRTVAPAKAYLTGSECKIADGVFHIPVDPEWLQNIEAGDKITCKDARGKKRELEAVEIKPDCILVHAFKTCYIETGAEVFVTKKGKSNVGDIPNIEGFLLLNQGDRLVIHGDKRPGENVKYSKKGALVSPAHISCTHPGVFEYVKPGEPILFDDGRIDGVIKEVHPGEMAVEILTAREGGTKLRADKGINLPDSALQISGLTEKDKEDLKYIAENADVVNMSFVNNKQDVQDLLDEIKNIGAENKLGMILKIETKSGFHNIVEILLTAMQIYPVGVMIARGDLAIECGWENIGRIQEEILWLCQAAHMPTIWATQVLENLAKKGIPSRAEITDAVMSQRADCVMLNKGPHITNAIAMLHHILRNMQNYQDKKAPMLPAMEMKI